jgi:polysaccharide lyase-like protein
MGKSAESLAKGFAKGTFAAISLLFFFELLCFPTAALSQLILNDDLEDEDASCWGSRASGGCNGWTSIRDAGISLATNEVANSGRKSIRLSFTKNEDFSGTTRIVNSRHIFTRFYDYYAEGFDFAAGMKIHRLSAYNASKQLNDFDIILYTQAEGGPDFCGTSEMQYLNFTYNGGPVDWGIVGATIRFQRNKWYCIETEVKLNAPGKSDGEIRIWVDGRIVAEKKGMNITGTISSPINRVLFGGWYSNSSAGRNPCPNPAQPSVRYIDDAAISTSYIGTIPTVSPGPDKGTRVVSWVMPEGGSSKIEYGITSSYGIVTAAEPQAQGRQSLVLTGLDTNRTYQYRILCTTASGASYISPGFKLSTFPQTGKTPAKVPSKPRILHPDRFDPIPD